MTQEIYAQLARISGQQSKIRAMRDQLAAFAEAISKQDAAFAELLLVARIPSAYRHCLAECMRRQGVAAGCCHADLKTHSCWPSVIAWWCACKDMSDPLGSVQYAPGS